MRRRCRLGWWTVWAAGCATPVGMDDVRIVDQASYTAACDAILGEVWPLDCASADEVPVEVTGADGVRLAQSLADLEGGFRCDQPSALSHCVPGSRVKVGQTSAGVPYVLVCRKYNERPDDPGGYDQIGVVASDPDSGATCYWSTPEDGLRRGDPLPKPGSAADLGWGSRSFWYTLPELRQAPCTACHDNDPWIHTPWIHRMDIPSAPLAPTWLVGADALGWPAQRRLVHPDAAPCTGCHALAEGRSCELALDAAGRKSWAMPVSTAFSAWPRSHWMDDFDHEVLQTRYADAAAWDARWGAAVEVIAGCCSGERVEGCWE